MDLSDVLDPSRCVVDARYADKAACLGDLAKRASVVTGLDKPVIVQALLHRESLGSTGLGSGIALPHARLRGLAAPFVLMVRLREPLTFEAVDGKPVDIVCLALIPETEPTSVLACLARRLRDPAALAAIRKAKTAESLRDAMVEGANPPP